MPEATGVIPPSCKSNYTVAPGDTCALIWRIMKIKQDDFFRLNPTLHIDGYGNCRLQVGQVVCIRGDITESTAGMSTPERKPPGVRPPPGAPPIKTLTDLSVVPVHPEPTKPAAVKLLEWLPMTFRTVTRENDIFTSTA
ncbi:uncharacterized protein BCR38DRAFT_486745 [Pseudomassariella vexata]|uniref:LysM domain-containing protein n=1 Tax=Pseudomassariella vexata TaxID=1141098 RepID=A0A1Y2DTJ7_9PEZI|nr:uncharacterized protein BCR38DRAFT_486745 [Pseudomassariella vexata]ORY62474.1 hypothetical protein BCR38DRAFT_486745 [Pseudomassariella vexata]